MDEPKPAYNTVSTVIRVLEKKGFVGHKAYGTTYEYYPLVKKKEYTAAQDTLIVPAAIKLLTGKNVTSFVSGTKTVENKDGEKKTETVGIVYFESKADANDAWEKMQDYAKDQNKDKDTDWQVKKSGKMIYWGTKAAINAAA